jgi:type IV secretion system protein VirB10
MVDDQEDKKNKNQQDDSSENLGISDEELEELLGSISSDGTNPDSEQSVNNSSNDHEEHELTHDEHEDDLFKEHYDHESNQDVHHDDNFEHNFAPHEEIDNEQEHDQYYRENTEKNNQHELQIDEGVSMVASSKKKNLIFSATAGVVFLIIGYFVVFSDGSSKTKKAPEHAEKNIAVPPEKGPEVANEVVNFAALPQINVPSPPSVPPIPTPPPINTVNSSITPPPPPPVLLAGEGKMDNQPTAVISQGLSRADALEAKVARLQSNITVLSGTGNKPEVDIGTNTLGDLKTTPGQVTATKIGNTNLIIAQGKIIDAILESAISTDMPGMTRAIISRDVYAETGANKLLPKGSRLIGQYDSSVKNGQAKVKIMWSRVIRPDGIDIAALNSQGVDNIGRAGIQGNMDLKIGPQVGNALLTTFINLVAARELDIIAAKQGVQQSGTVSATVTSNPATGTVVTQVPQQYTTNVYSTGQTSAQNMSTLLGTLAQQATDSTPAVTIDQGTRVKVFVQQDLVFPVQSTYGAKVLE